MSAVQDLVTRPVRVLAPVLLVAGLLMLLVGLGLGTRALAQPSVQVLAEGPSSGVRLPAAGQSGSLRLLGSFPPGAAPATAARCSSSPSRGTGLFLEPIGQAVSYRGRSYQSFQRIAEGWVRGATVSCTGTSPDRLLVARSKRVPALARAGLFVFAGLGGTVMGLAGSALRRHHHAPTTTTT